MDSMPPQSVGASSIPLAKDDRASTFADMTTTIDTTGTQSEAAAPALTASGLAALLCARICHDLVSPISALGTALEVLGDADNPDMHGDALDLIKLSAGQASAKLQYLRLAFGAGGSAPGVIGLDQVRELVEGLYGDGKVSVTIHDDLGELSKDSVRLLLNMVMMAVGAVPRGGTVEAHRSEDGARQILELVSTGPKARLADDVAKPLRGGMPESGFDGRSIQPFYASLLAREMGGKLTADVDGETVRFRADLPG